MDKALIHLYSQQVGEGIPFFSGYPRHQVGGSFLGGLLRIALPLLKSFGTSALNVAANTASDVVHNDKNLKESILSNTVREVKRKLPKTVFREEGSIYKRNLQVTIKKRKLK